MNYANDITGLCEDAAQAYLRQAGLTRMASSAIFTGLDDESLILPRTICLCQHAKRILEGMGGPPGLTGKWDADLQIIVRTNKDDTTRLQHRQTAGEVFAAFAIGRFDLADALSQFGNFIADDILMTEQQWDDVTGANNRSWRSMMMYSVKCRGLIPQ